MELTQAQLWQAIAAASTLVWVFKLITQWFPKWRPGEVFLSWMVYAVSMGLALKYTAFSFPVWTPVVLPFDFVTNGLRWIGSLVISLGPIAGTAMLFYVTIWQRFLEGTTKVVKKYFLKR